jgi:hypothetical protein
VKYTPVFRSGITINEANKYKAAKPIAPKLADVMYSLSIDAQHADEPFSKWCDMFGHDTDSIHALDVYRGCQANAAKLREILNKTEIEKLTELYLDY